MLMELEDEERRIEYNLTKKNTKLPNSVKVTLWNNLKKLYCKEETEV